MTRVARREGEVLANQLLLNSAAVGGSTIRVVHNCVCVAVNLADRYSREWQLVARGEMLNNIGGRCPWVSVHTRHVAELRRLRNHQTSGDPISDFADRLSELEVHAAHHFVVDPVPHTISPRVIVPMTLTGFIVSCRPPRPVRCLRSLKGQPNVMGLAFQAGQQQRDAEVELLAPARARGGIGRVRCVCPGDDT
jgi:hypothetical protein